MEIVGAIIGTGITLWILGYPILLVIAFFLRRRARPGFANLLGFSTFSFVISGIFIAIFASILFGAGDPVGGSKVFDYYVLFIVLGITFMLGIPGVWLSKRLHEKD